MYPPHGIRANRLECDTSRHLDFRDGGSPQTKLLNRLLHHRGCKIIEHDPRRGRVTKQAELLEGRDLYYSFTQAIPPKAFDNAFKPSGGGYMIFLDENRTGEIVECDAGLDDLTPPLEIIESVRGEKKVNLKAARIIVSGGAGVGSRESFKLIWDLAGCLGAAVGGSRAAVDLGFVDHDHQVGQTGTTVRPALYIACGISGAVQHRAGMEESAKILAINTDRDAPIFQVAHMGIVGDMNVVIPKLIKAIRSGAGPKA